MAARMHLLGIAVPERVDDSGDQIVQELIETDG